MNSEMDAVFKALADSFRRKLLDRLNRREGQTLAELCKGADMTRFGVMKHLRLLEQAGLVVTRREGREKLHYLNRVPIRRLHDRWISRYAEPMAAALSRLKTALEEPMSEGRLVYEIFVRATPEKLWRAITQPEFTRQYFHGSAITTPLKKGGPYRSEAADGTLLVDGEFLECDPPRRLVHTWRVHWNPALSHELSTVTYEIEQRGDNCKLTVTHEVAQAPQTAAVVKGGWPAILSSLKSLVETGKPLVM
ncbi:ArsR/SmtB family transcription factor [Rudaea sp.]|uniref:ArsR/SmtB family transcription factor n=1 Tax=Rudaea sp. TaxID=2136325 RepID=UPI002ED0A735